jgi:hypothetical protein
MASGSREETRHERALQLAFGAAFTALAALHAGADCRWLVAGAMVGAFRLRSDTSAPLQTPTMGALRVRGGDARCATRAERTAPRLARLRNRVDHHHAHRSAHGARFGTSLGRLFRLFSARLALCCAKRAGAHPTRRAAAVRNGALVQLDSRATPARGVGVGGEWTAQRSQFSACASLASVLSCPVALCRSRLRAVANRCLALCGAGAVARASGSNRQYQI